MGSPFPGPQAPYQNPPINPQYFQPSQFFISAITKGQTTLITTTANVNYIIGQLVRLIIPPSFGIRQLNEQEAYVIGIPNPNQVIVDIDSTSYDSFISSSATTQPQILAIGDISSGIISNTGNFNLNTNIPGAFINISPL